MILLKLSYSFNSRFSLAFFDFIVFCSLIHGEKKNQHRQNQKKIMYHISINDCYFKIASLKPQQMELSIQSIQYFFNIMYINNMRSISLQNFTTQSCFPQQWLESCNTLFHQCSKLFVNFEQIAVLSQFPDVAIEYQ